MKAPLVRFTSLSLLLLLGVCAPCLADVSFKLTDATITLDSRGCVTSLRSADKRLEAASELVDWLRSRRSRIEIPAPSRSTQRRPVKEPRAACGRGTTRVARQSWRVRESESSARSSLI